MEAKVESRGRVQGVPGGKGSLLLGCLMGNSLTLLGTPPHPNGGGWQRREKKKYVRLLSEEGLAFFEKLSLCSRHRLNTFLNVHPGEMKMTAD